METKVTKKKTEKPGKFPWERPNGKLVDDFRLVTSINELIWRSFDKGSFDKENVANYPFSIASLRRIPLSSRRGRRIQNGSFLRRQDSCLSFG